MTFAVVVVTDNVASVVLTSDRLSSELDSVENKESEVVDASVVIVSVVVTGSGVLEISALIVSLDGSPGGSVLGIGVVSTLTLDEVVSPLGFAGVSTVVETVSGVPFPGEFSVSNLVSSETSADCAAAAAVVVSIVVVSGVDVVAVIDAVSLLLAISLLAPLGTVALESTFVTPAVSVCCRCETSSAPRFSFLMLADSNA